MRSFLYQSGIALSVLLLVACGGSDSVVAPSSVQLHDGSKTAAAATGQTEAAKKGTKKANMQARKAAWNALSDAEKSAKKANMQAR